MLIVSNAALIPKLSPAARELLLSILRSIWRLFRGLSLTPLCRSGATQMGLA
jgi:hypothetical protein